MNTGEAKDRVVRIHLTDEEWKNLRKLAVERDQEIRTLVTESLRVSPLMSGVFKG